MQKKVTTNSDSVLNPFVEKHQADVIGVLRGFDRLRLAGTFRALYHPPVMEKYIQKAGFLLKDFKQLMLQVTGQIKAATQQMAQRTGRPLTYVSSSQVRKDGPNYRGLNPWSEKDALMLEAVNRGELAINGFRNRDLRPLLFPTKGTHEEQKRRAGTVTRKIRLLRAHGLIRKVSGTHRDGVSEKGRRIITALMSARQADVQQLTALAA